MNAQKKPIDILKPLYDSSSFASVLPDIYHADGMIFAVASAPEIPMPEQWMPWLVQHSSGVLVDSDVDVIADALMNTLRSHLQHMRDEQSSWPFSTVNLGDNASTNTALSCWLKGLLTAHQQLDDVWQRAWQNVTQQPLSIEPPEKRLTRCLKLFSTLADEALALRQRNDEQAKVLKENLPALRKQVSPLLSDYVALAGELAQSLPNQFEMFSSLDS